VSLKRNPKKVVMQAFKNNSSKKYKKIKKNLIKMKILIALCFSRKKPKRNSTMAMVKELCKRG
jgi:hypothetical protein